MSKEQAAQTEEQENEPRPWRPWRPTRRPTWRDVLWAAGMVAALVAIALLVGKLYPGVWQHVSKEPLAILKGRVPTLIGIGAALTVIIVLLALGGASLGWTGFGEKKLWDWLQLLSALAIPVVLAAAGLWFTAQQNQRQVAIEDQRTKQAQKIENQRAEAERELAQQRAQDEALQLYLDQMSMLLLDKNLRDPEEGSEARTLARARTLTVLGRLDPSRKTQVMQFLVEADLVRSVDERDPVISLNDADLRSTDLSGANLSGADLSEADLSEADLSEADLSTADLSRADLSAADLGFAHLYNADLYNADLYNADLGDARLWNADLSSADLRFADLRFARLWNADLSSADLGFADLREANLSGAAFTVARLSNAELFNATGITSEELEHQAYPLQGAIMPDGQLHAGKYVTRVFEPALSFNISGDGWQRAYEARNYLPIESPGGYSEIFFTKPEISFTRPLHVFDPSNLSEPKEVPAPENVEEWVSWLQRHPNLKTSKQVPESVGGASGMRIDVTASSAPENYSRVYCSGQPCVPLFPASAALILVYYGEWTNRFVIVDVEGETVVINVAAPADKFDEFAPVAQKVLDTVEWQK